MGGRVGVGVAVGVGVITEMGVDVGVIISVDEAVGGPEGVGTAVWVEAGVDVDIGIGDEVAEGGAVSVIVGGGCGTAGGGVGGPEGVGTAVWVEAGVDVDIGFDVAEIGTMDLLEVIFAYPFGLVFVNIFVILPVEVASPEATQSVLRMKMPIHIIAGSLNFLKFIE